MSLKKRRAPDDNRDKPATMTKHDLPVYKWLVGSAQLVDRHVYFDRSTPLCEAPYCILGRHDGQYGTYKLGLTRLEMETPDFEVIMKCTHPKRYVSIKPALGLLEFRRKAKKEDPFFNTPWNENRQNDAFRKYQLLCEQNVKFTAGERLVCGYYSSRENWSRAYDEFAPFDEIPRDILLLILKHFLTYNYWLSGSQFGTLAAVCKQWYSVVNGYNIDDKKSTGNNSFYASVSLRVVHVQKRNLSASEPDDEDFDSDQSYYSDDGWSESNRDELSCVPLDAFRESNPASSGPNQKEGLCIPIFLYEISRRKMQFTVPQIEKTIMPLWPSLSGISDEIEKGRSKTIKKQIRMRVCFIRIISRLDKDLASKLISCTSSKFLQGGLENSTPEFNIPSILCAIDDTSKMSRTGKFTAYCYLIANPVVRAGTTTFREPEFYEKIWDENDSDYGDRWLKKIAKEALEYTDWPEMKYLLGMLNKWRRCPDVCELFFQSGLFDFNRDRLGKHRRLSIWESLLSKMKETSSKFIADHFHELNLDQQALFIKKTTVTEIKLMFTDKKSVFTADHFFVSALGHNRTAAIFEALPRETKNALFPDWLKYI